MAGQGRTTLPGGCGCQLLSRGNRRQQGTPSHLGWQGSSLPLTVLTRNTGLWRRKYLGSFYIFSLPLFESLPCSLCISAFQSLIVSFCLGLPTSPHQHHKGGGVPPEPAPPPFRRTWICPGRSETLLAETAECLVASRQCRKEGVEK